MGQDQYADAPQQAQWASVLERTRHLAASEGQPKDELYTKGSVHDMLAAQFLMISDFLVQRIHNTPGTEPVKQALHAYCRLMILLGTRIGSFVRNIVIFLADIKPELEVL